ncbi:hypothetical protein DCS_05171 [Drechmeria coniospora]|uniref:Zinc finger, FYVE domain containing protein n=1 Tax=Drechmeria coniospora TaxID=98403 RepID=A0A151GM55_DRECN|nr:hypothetical protein DCS_05171 [Drechmeria coniospora]KYK58158.1 hypothetical protein DCS_05171 [Drechmeria coniospora]
MDETQGQRRAKESSNDGLEACAEKATVQSPSRLRAAEGTSVVEDDVDGVFETDDRTLEQLLADVDAVEEPSSIAHEPRDEEVKALLRRLRDDDKGPKGVHDSDDSDGEKMATEVHDIIARFRDEIDLDPMSRQDDLESPLERNHSHREATGTEDDELDEGMDLPTLPSNLDVLPSGTIPNSTPTTDVVAAASSVYASSPAPSTALEDLTARMAALRAPSPALRLPTVPSGQPTPAGEPVRRLTSTTDYTDDDVDSWCTVCLEDAALRCLGCEDDPYCVRCWREMHQGSAAAFDDQAHKAVQFTKNRKAKEPKLALGAV